MIHDIEYLSTLASVKQLSFRYPKKEIVRIWESILLCQFHDCLPGSSIRMCYDDSDKLYAEVFAVGRKLLSDALLALGFVDIESSNLNQTSQGLVAINTLPWPRTELVKLPSSDYALVKGASGAIKVEKLPTTSTASVTAREIKKGIFELSNDQYKLEIENGAIISLIDLTANRQVIADGGRANQMVIFDDKPLYRQAWDVEVFHLTSRQELPGGATEIAEQCLHKASVVTKTKISDKSWVKSTISLSTSTKGAGSVIEVDTEVEWHEDMKFLKVEFDVNVSNTVASYETQYGIVKRPTHYNTAWDMAKFEVCCHKWADLSENGYGVSILNDSKYGFATCGSLMRLSLLRSPKAPDAHADMGKSTSITFNVSVGELSNISGRHHIRYAIFPHTGSLDTRTIHAAYNFNNPMQLYLNPGKSSLDDISITGDPSVILDGMKRGEDDEDVSQGTLKKRTGQSIILRVFESLGGQAHGAIRAKLQVKEVWKCNVLEDDQELLTFQNGEVKFTLRSFEVATFRLQL